MAGCRRWWLGLPRRLVEGHPWWLVALAGLGLGAAVLVAARVPRPGLLLLAAAVGGLGVLGLRSDVSTAPAVPMIIGLVVVAYLLPWQAGAWAVPLLLVSTMLVGAWDEPATWVFGLVLTTLPWWFGQAVRRRDLARQQAGEQAEELARVDLRSVPRSRPPRRSARTPHTGSASWVTGWAR